MVECGAATIAAADFCCVVRTIAIMAFFTGFRARITRISGVVAGVCGLIALSQHPFGFIFTLYTLFVGTIALALSTEPIVKRSPLRIVHVFVISIYAWSAIAKMSAAWLSGDTLRALAEDGLLSPWVASLLMHHESLFRAAAISVVAHGSRHPNRPRDFTERESSPSSAR